MEVTEQPLAFVSDKSQREITLLAPGLRVTMTGAEALALWGELGDLLKAVYGTPADGSPATPEARSRKELPSPPAASWSKEIAVDRLLKGIISHSQTPLAERDRREKNTNSKPNGDPAKPSGVVGRALGKLTGATRA